jgi:hypothetical protein
MKRKIRIAEIEMKMSAQETGEERRAHVRALMSRLGEFSNRIESQLRDPDWATKREIIRAVVQRIETRRATSSSRVKSMFPLFERHH